MSTARGEAGTSVARARDLVFVRLRRFDVGDYHRLGESGVLSPEDRVELIDGEIVEMTPIGSRHAMCVARLTSFFSGRTGSKAVVFVQSPIRLGRHSEPQPDLAILDPGDYSSHLPASRNVQLVIEVADSSLDFDRGVKVPLYARARIPEVWLVDLPGEAVEVLRHPARAGYREVTRARRSETLSPLAFPDLAVPIDGILGPRLRRRRS